MPRQSVGTAIMAIGLALGATLTGCQSEAAPTEVPDEEAAEVALTSSLPYGVDVSGQDLGVTTLDADVTLQALLEGKEFSVLNAFQAVSRDPELPGADCTGDDCRQVEIYNYSDQTTIVATVDMDSDEVLDVHVLPDASPALSPELRTRVMQLVDADPRVVEALAGRDYDIGMPPVATRQDDGPCATDWCILVSLAPDDEQPREGGGDRLIVIVDIDTEEVVDVFWRSTLRQEVDG